MNILYSHILTAVKAEGLFFDFYFFVKRLFF